MKKRKPDPIPAPAPAPKLTPAEERQRILWRFKSKLERLLADHLEARKKIATDLLSERGLFETLNMLKWSNELAARSFEAEVAYFLLNVQPGDVQVELIDRIIYWHKRLQGALLRNEFSAPSSSPFSNACTLASAEGARRMYESLDCVLYDWNAVNNGEPT